jgi:uncharacterized protein YdhG (YjbR/CyaY superfamily)
MERSEEVDKYIAGLPEACRSLIEEMRNYVFEIAGDNSEFEERFAYQIDVYKYKGKALFSLAGFPNHCSLITQDKDIAVKIPELKGYKISGTSIHFTEEHPIPKELLEKIIKLRIGSRDNG